MLSPWFLVCAITGYYLPMAICVAIQAPAQVEALLASVSVTNIDNIRGNIHLPEFVGGLKVSWSSNNSSIISADGVVMRQDTDTEVTLVATVDEGGTKYRRTFTATVLAAVKDSDYDAYAFAYFTGETVAGEKVYFAASQGNNALDWTEVNSGQPVLTSTHGTKGLRDPFIIRSAEGDTFYLLATDLSISSGTSWAEAVANGSLYIEIWESNDLATWSDQRHVLVSPPTAGNTWAPEAFYDTDLGSYVVYWASTLYAEDDTAHSGATYHRMLYATTRDFVTFSEPQIWQDAGSSRIDSTVIEENGVYYRFTKDDGAVTGCSDIIQESSSNLVAELSGWTTISSCIGQDAGTSAVEGPTSFKSNLNDVNGEKFYLFLDEYKHRGYIPLETEDMTNPSWTVSSSYNLPASPRHGTVIPITSAELATLTGSAIEKSRSQIP